MISSSPFVLLFLVLLTSLSCVESFAPHTALCVSTMRSPTVAVIRHPVVVFSSNATQMGDVSSGDNNNNQKNNSNDNNKEKPDSEATTKMVAMLQTLPLEQKAGLGVAAVLVALLMGYYALQLATLSAHALGDEVLRELGHLLQGVAWIVATIAGAAARLIWQGAQVAAPVVGQAVWDGAQAAAPVVREASKVVADAASPYVEQAVQQATVVAGEASQQVGAAAAPYVDSARESVQTTLTQAMDSPLVKDAAQTVTSTVDSTLKGAAQTVTSTVDSTAPLFKSAGEALQSVLPFE